MCSSDPVNEGNTGAGAALISHGFKVTHSSGALELTAGGYGK